MKLSAMRYYLAVAEAGSVRQAAERQNISASSITRHIQSLEQHFGTVLLDRSRTGISLTVEGKALEAHFRTVIQEIERARSDIDKIKGLTTGTIRFATIEGVVHSWLFPVISDFRNDYPGVTFSGKITGSEAVVDAVTNGLIDFGVAINPEPLPQIEILAEIPTGFAAVLSPEHPLAGQDQLSLAELAPYDLALLDQSFHTRKAMLRAGHARRIDFRIVMELNHIDALVSFIALTKGISVIPGFAVSPAFHSLGLKMLPVTELENTAEQTKLIVNNTRRMTTAAKQFLSRLKTTCTSAPK